MGWAKYMEDNVEIMIERQVSKDYKYQARTIKDENLLFTSLFPACISANLKVAVNVGDLSDMESEYTDRVLICKCCGQKFVFTATAQKEYARNNWCSPKRCRQCRKKRNSLKSAQCAD